MDRVVGTAELAHHAPHAFLQRLLPQVQPLVEDHVHALIREAGTGTTGVSPVAHRKRLRRTPPRKPAAPRHIPLGPPLPLNVQRGLRAALATRHQLPHPRPIPLHHLNRQFLGRLPQRKGKRLEIRSAQRTLPFILAKPRPRRIALLRLQRKRRDLRAVRLNGNRHRTRHHLQAQPVVRRRRVLHLERFMQVLPPRPPQSPHRTVLRRRPRGRIRLRLVILDRLPDGEAEVRERRGPVAASRLSHAGHAVKPRHGHVPAVPAVDHDEALRILLPDRRDQHAAHALVVLDGTETPGRFVDQVEEQLLARNVLVAARQHRPVQDGRAQAVFVLVDVARLGIHVRHAVFARNPVQTDHRHDPVLPRVRDARVERLQARLVDDLAVRALPVLHPAAVVKRHADEVEPPLLHPLEMLLLEPGIRTRPAHPLQVEAPRLERRLPLRRRAAVVLARADGQRPRRAEQRGRSCNRHQKNRHLHVVYKTDYAIRKERFCQKPMLSIQSTTRRCQPATFTLSPRPCETFA